eukprot:15446576-Alexandrium_andersonii.AAC.1
MPSGSPNSAIRQALQEAIGAAPKLNNNAGWKAIAKKLLLMSENDLQAAAARMGCEVQTLGHMPAAAQLVQMLLDRAATLAARF